MYYFQYPLQSMLQAMNLARAAMTNSLIGAYCQNHHHLYACDKRKYRDYGSCHWDSRRNGISDLSSFLYRYKSGSDFTSVFGAISYHLLSPSFQDIAGFTFTMNGLQIRY